MTNTLVDWPWPCMLNRTGAWPSFFVCRSRHSHRLPVSLACIPQQRCWISFVSGSSSDSGESQVMKPQSRSIRVSHPTAWVSYFMPRTSPSVSYQDAGLVSFPGLVVVLTLSGTCASCLPSACTVQGWVWWRTVLTAVHALQCHDPFFGVTKTYIYSAEEF